VTVTLRQRTRADHVWLDTWLPAVAESVGYDASSLDRAQKRLIIQRNIDEGRGTDAPGCAGIIVYRTGAPSRGDAIIELVATPPEHARHGAGMEGAVLIEQQLRSSHIRRIYAPAAATHGIAIYFWIRLGYRPLLRGEWPCARAGVAWLARDL
jgi:hypothetical protein